MALQGYDGFDHYGSGTDFFARNGFIQYENNGVTVNSFPIGRTDGKAVDVSQFVTGGQLQIVFQQRVAAAGVGFAHLLSVSNPQYFAFYDTIGAAIQCAVVFDTSNYSIKLYKGGSWAFNTYTPGVLLYQTNNNVWARNIWNYIELWTTVGSSGSITVLVNGQVLATYSGNTQQTANAQWDRLDWLPAGSAGGSLLDDLYYADTTVGAGTYPCDTPLGDVHVYTRFPIGNSSVQWAPLSGANWQEVSEIAMDSNASYNSSATAGQEDLFNFAALTATISHIIGVQITGAYRKDDAGTRTLKQALKSSSTELYGTTRSVPMTLYTYWSDLSVIDPNTSSSWTLTAVNNVAGGYNLVS